MPMAAKKLVSLVKHLLTLAINFIIKEKWLNCDTVKCELTRMRNERQSQNSNSIVKLKTTTQKLKLERQKQNYNLEIQILSPKVF